MIFVKTVIVILIVNSQEFYCYYFEIILLYSSQKTLHFFPTRLLALSHPRSLNLVRVYIALRTELRWVNVPRSSMYLDLIAGRKSPPPKFEEPRTHETTLINRLAVVEMVEWNLGKT